MTLAQPGFYAAHRPYALPAALEDLDAPISGRVQLPIHLDWAPGDRTYDLTDPDDLRWLYSQVIGEAMTSADLSAYLNADLLRRVWVKLVLTTRVRLGWEERFPELRTIRESAAQSA